MDNFRFDMTCEGEATLAAAMALAFNQHRSATHYAVRQASAAAYFPQREGDTEKRVMTPARPYRLIFYWVKSSRGESTEFPFKMDAAGASDWANRWLAEADFGKQPDHDGDNGRGWRLYNEAWGHVDDDYAAFLAVTPAWAMYGK